MPRLALALLTVLAVAGCSSNGPDSAACASSGFEARGSFSATAAGEAFTAACIGASVQGTAFVVNAIENLGSAGASQRSISFSVVNPKAGANPALTASYADVDLANPTAGAYAAQSATVQFDAFTTTAAKGTFSFSARNNAGQTVQVTNGRFDLTY